jgi:hypothetical protein
MLLYHFDSEKMTFLVVYKIESRDKESKYTNMTLRLKIWQMDQRKASVFRILNLKFLYTLKNFLQIKKIIVDSTQIFLIPTFLDPFLFLE